MLNYTKLGLPQSSELIGISSASSSVLTSSHAEKDLLSDVQNWNGDAVCQYDSEGNIIKTTCTLWRDKTKCYLDSLNDQRSQWYYAGTAFLNRVGTTNEIYWYISKYDTDIQKMIRFNYTFYSEYSLTSKVASPDAPTLCMTAYSDPDTILYLDDINRAITINERLIDTVTDYDGFYYKKSGKYKNTIRLGMYTIPRKQALCRGQNTQLNNLAIHNSDSSFQLPTNENTCYMRTTILLEEEDLGIFHLIQIKQPRAQTSNNLNAESGRYGYLFDCSSAKLVVSQQTYTFPAPSISKLNFKAFVNAGWNDKTSIPGYFYTIGVKDGHIVAETNSPSLRCQELLPTSNADFNLIELTPLNFTFESTPSWRDLTSYAPSVILGSSAKSAVQGAQLNLTTYNYTICSKPQVLFFDNVIKDKLLCLVIDNTTKDYQNFLYQDKNLVSNYQLNIWPYTTCSDRNLIPLTTYTHIDYYLNATIYDPGYLIHRKKNEESDSTIKFIYNRNKDYANSASDDNITLNFTWEDKPWRLLEKTLTFSIQVGNDSTVQTWDQRLLLLKNCMPDKMIWDFPPEESQSKNLDYPIYYTYFYTEGQVVFRFPKPIITNFDIDYYPENDGKYFLPFEYQISLNDSSIPSQFFTISKEAQTITVVAEGGDLKTVKFDLKATSLNEYYYIDPTTKAMTQGQLPIIIYDFAVITFALNIAPYFDPPLYDMIFQVPQDNLIVNLPDIKDDDSNEAYIQSYKVSPLNCQSFINVIVSKSKQQNMLRINAGRSIDSNITCTVFITLIDIMKTPRSSTSSFQIAFQVPSVKNLIVSEINKNNQQQEIEEANLKNKNKPRVEIDQIDSVGNLSLKFNIPMKRTINPKFNLSSVERKLKAITYNSYQDSQLVVDYVKQFIHITQTQFVVDSGRTSQLPDPNYYVNSFDGIFLDLKLVFPDEKLLSKSKLQKVDSLTIVINNTSILISESGLVPIDQSWTLTTILPIQNGNKTEVQQGKKLAQIAKSTMAGIMTSNFVLNILIAQSMQKLWSQLNIIKLIVHTPLLQIVMPPNTDVLFGALISVCSFDFLESEQITNKIFGRENFSENSLIPLNERLNLLSYSNGNFIYNLGTMFYIYLIVIALTVAVSIFTVLFKLVPGCCQPKILKKILNYCWRKITPGLYVRMFIESNFELLIVAYIQLKINSTATTKIDNFSVVLASFSVFVCSVIPVISALKIAKMHRKKQLHDRRFLYWYGELYEQYMRPVYTRLYQVMFNIIFMMRYSLTLICIFFLDWLPGVQLFLLMTMLVLVQGKNLHNKPYYNPQLNHVHFMNEIVYYNVLLLSLAFTPFLSDEQQDDKIIIGTAVNVLVILMIVINVLLIAYDSLQQSYRFVYKTYFSFWANIRLQKIQKELQKKQKKYRKKIEIQQRKMAEEFQISSILKEMDRQDQLDNRKYNNFRKQQFLPSIREVSEDSSVSEKSDNHKLTLNMIRVHSTGIPHDISFVAALEHEEVQFYQSSVQLDSSSMQLRLELNAVSNQQNDLKEDVNPDLWEKVEDLNKQVLHERISKRQPAKIEYNDMALQANTVAQLHNKTQKVETTEQQNRNEDLSKIITEVLTRQVEEQKVELKRNILLQNRVEINLQWKQHMSKFETENQKMKKSLKKKKLVPAKLKVQKNPFIIF